MNLISANIDRNRISSNIQFAVGAMYKIIVLSTIIELLFFPSIDAIIYSIFALLGVFIVQNFLLSASNVLHYMVSTIAITMYVFFFLVLPMPATLLEFKPITYNMHDTIWTGFNILLLVCLLVMTHKVYRGFANGKNVLGRLLLKTPIYTKFTVSELWVAVIVGTLIYVYAILKYGLHSDEGNVYQTMSPVEYMLSSIFLRYSSLVVIFLFPKFNIIKTENYKIRYALIIAICVISFVMGIATNMRTAAVENISVAAFAFLYYWLLFLSKNTIKVKKILPWLIIGLVFINLFQNVSNAMVKVRGDRNNKDGIEVLEMTLQEMESSTKESEKHNKIPDIMYSEEYLDNTVLSRFCSIKIHDETLYRAAQIGYANKEMQKSLEENILSLLPKFIKSKLGLSLKIQGFSLTDELAYLAKSAGRGGIKIGTLQGLGLAIYGWWYLPILFIVYLLIFPCMDSIVYFDGKQMRFSWVFMGSLIMWCYWFSDRHYYNWEYKFLMRTFLESVIFTSISVWVIKRIPFLKH